MERTLRLLRSPAVAIVCVTVLAATLRLWGLSHPAVRVFDEAYYTRSSCRLLGWSDERCGIRDERLYEWVHPPLGRYAIALGELVLHFDASDGLSHRDTISFRLPSAIAGTLTVALVALSAGLLFGTPGAAWLAGTLLAVEGLSVVQSRIGMLDVFLCFWIVVAFTCLLLDRRSVDTKGWAYGRWLRPWRLATGVALGGAIATKWSGLMALIGVVGIATWLESRDRRAQGVTRPRHTLWIDGTRIVTTLVIVPLLVYLCSYAKYLIEPQASLASLVRLNVAMAQFHSSHRGPADEEACASAVPPTGCANDVSARPLDWLLLRGPIIYWGNPTPGQPFSGERAIIIANGNPGIFLGAFASVPLALYLAIRRRDRAAAAIGTMALVLYLPWFAVHRVEYVFYALPIVPFLVLAFVLLVRNLRATGQSTIGNAVAAFTVGLGLVLWPLHSGVTMPDVGWRILQPFFPAWWGSL